MHIFVVTDGRWQICRLLCDKNTKYNFSVRVSLLHVTTITGISTNWFENFQRFELRRVIFPRESRNGSSLREFRIIEGSRNRG